MVIEKQNPNTFTCTTELSFFFNPNKHFHITIALVIKFSGFIYS